MHIVEITFERIGSWYWKCSNAWRWIHWNQRELIFLLYFKKKNRFPSFNDPLLFRYEYFSHSNSLGWLWWNGMFNLKSLYKNVFSGIFTWKMVKQALKDIVLVLCWYKCSLHSKIKLQSNSILPRAISLEMENSVFTSLHNHEQFL